MLGEVGYTGITGYDRLCGLGMLGAHDMLCGLRMLGGYDWLFGLCMLGLYSMLFGIIQKVARRLPNDLGKELLCGKVVCRLGAGALCVLEDTDRKNYSLVCRMQ